MEKLDFPIEILDIVIEPLYDFAFPFHDGISEVCVGCRDLKFDGVDLLDASGSGRESIEKGLL